MSNIKIELNGQGIRELLKSEEIKAELSNQAERIMSNCSGNYETEEYIGAKRRSISIVTKDADTFHKNLKNNELLMALHG